MAHWVKLTTHGDTRGKLTVIEKVLPFDLKRVYYIYDVPPDNIRGGHRHKKTIQAFVSIKGSCRFVCDNSKEKDEFVLDDASKCLIVPPEDWHQIKDFSPDCVLLGLASELYSADDYIAEPYR
ncbi:MAG: FdtA/QdtA family cupin domain-containing protein [Leptospirales bacterium]|nr:FdtA/QdtA family cupin domain-containing protein [Leptospirales bacterium]